MEAALLEALATGGPVAILALIIFIMYRKDRASSEQRQRDDRVFMEDRLTKLIQDCRACMDAQRASQDAHTIVQSELVVLLRTMNGRN